MFSEIRVAMVSDVKGNDDEGMKKIARRLGVELNELEGLSVELVNLKKVFLRVRAFDVIHFIGGPSYKTIILVALFRLLNRRVKSILTFTNPFWDRRADVLFDIMKPDYSIALSEKWFEILSKKNARTGLLCVSGVDSEKFKPVTSELKSRYRKKIGIPEDKLVVLHVGHIKDDRNISYLKELQSDEIQVVVVGSTTTDKSLELKSDLEKSNVLVVDHYVEKIEQYYQLSDCYVFPTTDERGAVQVPLSILEALATNLPVLTTDFGGVKRFFYGCSSLSYIDSFDLDLVLESIRGLIAKEKDGAAFIKKYSWDTIAAELASIYKEVI